MGLFGKKPTRSAANVAAPQNNVPMGNAQMMEQAPMNDGDAYGGDYDLPPIPAPPTQSGGKPKPAKPVKQRPPKKEKPVPPAKKQKPVPPVKKEKPKKLSAKEKKELAMREKQEAAERVAMEQQGYNGNQMTNEQIPMPLQDFNYSGNIGYSQPMTSIPPMPDIPNPMQVQQTSEDIVVGGLLNQMHAQMDGDWHRLAKEITVRSNGTVTDLEGFCSALNVATLKAKADGSALAMNYGKIVGLMLNKADPGFITGLQRIVDGHLELVKVVRPFDSREASYGEFKVYTDFVDEALKYNIVLVGVLQFGKPYITEGKLDSIDNKIVGRFPSTPEAIAILSLVNE